MPGTLAGNRLAKDVMAPLVSILIPAYHERFFGEAFGSAMAQTLEDREIVVCDDSGGDAIARHVREHGDARVRYVANPTRRGFAANFTQCLALARGRFVKFLNDDDRLGPRCVEVLAGVLEDNAGVRLATTRRTVIDEAGRPAPDLPGTTPVSHVSAFMSGLELGDFCLANGVNFIGEPSTVLFRREDFTPEAASMFHWSGHEFHCLADLSVWLRLLRVGLAFYGAVPLSEYRRHAAQQQREPGMALACLLERESILGPAAASGFLARPGFRAAAVRSVRRLAAGFEAAARADRSLADRVKRMEASLAAFEAG